MRIGLSTSVIQRGQTGIAQYLFALIRAFAARRNGDEFTLFVLEEDLPLFAFVRSVMRLVTVPEKFRSPLKNILWHQMKLPKLARELRLDVLHVPSYRRMLWSQPCALVATIHDLAAFKVARKYNRLRMFYGRVVARRLARRQNQIIAVSKNTAEDIAAHFGIAPARVTVIHNGLDHERFFPASHQEANVEAANKFNLRKPFFLYVARLEHPGKNHVRLISAFNQFKATTDSNWQLVFGGTDSHGVEDIREAVRLSLFAPDIRSLGFVADADLPLLYRTAQVFVYPSLYEGFGMPPLEAMACGCPVLCSARGSLHEVVEEAALICDPENVDELAKQLTELARNTELRKQLRRSGLARASHFDWQKSAEATLDVYRRAVLAN